ncbi:MAG: putative manganese transporter [Flavobacteriales bacterium]
MEFNLWSFIVENLEAAGVIGGYVSISMIMFALISYASRNRIRRKDLIGPKWAQPIIGALLGVIPGCGGTIVAASMYKNGNLKFGGLFAAFITTLGEGSFVLLGASDEADVAANLSAFAIVSVVGLVVGIILGYITDASGLKFNKVERLEITPEKHISVSEEKSAARNFIDYIGFYVIMAIAIFLAPGSIMALWGGSIEAISELTVWVAIVLTVISIVYYFIYRFILKEDCHAGHNDNLRSTLLHSIEDITMVITYVFIGLFAANFIIDVLIGAEAFEAWMKKSGFIVVTLAALIGATPGCGGMIAVAVAFITIGDFPMAALIAASIATSGDGIFPLLAENRKDAIIITVSGLAVALVVGYAALGLGF